MSDYQNELRKELIQVAAVAVAAIQDIDRGSTEMSVLQERDPHTVRVLGQVEAERHRQEAKWGVQHHDPRVWLVILGEEFGEACQAALRLKHDLVREFDEAKLVAVQETP